MSLDTMAARAKWPTPTARFDWPNEGNVRQLRKKVKNGDLTAEEASLMIGGSIFKKQGKLSVWPTPSALDWKGSGKTGQYWDRLDYATERGRTNTQSYLTCDQPTEGQLNPAWVEWLMGWPIGWTLLEPLEDLGRWGSDEWWDDEQDIPRTTTTKKDRPARLRALGNGWVPLCGATAYRQLTKETT